LLEPQEEFMLAKRWREHGDREAAHRLVTSHLRLVAKMPWLSRLRPADLRGDLGRQRGPDAGGQAVRARQGLPPRHLRHVVDQGIDPGIHPALVVAREDGTTANQKKLFFNLRKAKSKISALEEGDMRPDQVKLIAKRLGVTEQDVIDMNRRLGGDASLNAPIRDDGDSGEWQDWLMDDSASQESVLAENEELDNRRTALGQALTVLNDRERRIFEARRLADDPITLEISRPSSACRASACVRSRSAPSRRCRKRCATVSPRWKARRWRRRTDPASPRPG